MPEIYIDTWITFHLDSSGRWQVAMWTDAAKPLNARVYRLRVKVPAELVGEAQATVNVAAKRTATS